MGKSYTIDVMKFASENEIEFRTAGELLAGIITKYVDESDYHDSLLIELKKQLKIIYPGFF